MNDSNTLADVTDDGQAVDSRLTSGEQARDRAMQFLRDNKIRNDRMTIVQGLIGGNPPKSQQAMEDEGRDGDSNVNWGDARGQLLNAWTPYFDLVCEVPVCVDADLTYSDAERDAELVRRFCEAFHKMVFNWNGYDLFIQEKDWQMLSHGFGLPLWRDKWNWQPDSVLAVNSYVPDETRITLDNLEELMITRTVSGGQLWREAQMDNLERSKALGWDHDGILDALNNSYVNTENEMLQWRLDKWQQMFKNGDIWLAQNNTKKILLCHFFIQEMDGTITQKVIRYSTAGKDGKFLYQSPERDRRDDWSQVICPFFYDVGADGTWHSVKGLGTEIFASCVLFNKIKNGISDLLVIGIKPTWQATSGEGLEKFQTAKFGGGNLIPQGFTNVDLRVGDNLQPALLASQEFRRSLMTNTGTYQEDIAPPTVEETAKAAMIRAADRSKLTKGAHNRQMRGYDRLYAEMWRRAVNEGLTKLKPGGKEAVKFREECYRACDELGVPHGALQAVENVRAFRSWGLGSASMRIEIANAFMSPNFIDRLDPQGQNMVKRMYAATMTGYHNVDAIVPSLNKPTDATDQDVEAASEDNDMTLLGTRAEVVITPRQNSVIHLNHHLQSAVDDVELWEQEQLDDQTALDTLEKKLMHSQEHLQILLQSSAQAPLAKGFVKSFKQIMDARSEIISHAEQMAEAQGQPTEQETSGQQNPQMIKVLADAQRKDYKQQADLQRKMQHQQFSQVLAAQHQQFQQALDAHKLGAQTAIDARKAGADTMIKAGQTAADIQLQRMKTTQ